jgi:hypothetical protein
MAVSRCVPANILKPEVAHLPAVSIFLPSARGRRQKCLQKKEKADDVHNDDNDDDNSILYYLCARLTATRTLTETGIVWMLLIILQKSKKRKYISHKASLENSAVKSYYFCCT